MFFEVVTLDGVVVDACVHRADSLVDMEVADGFPYPEDLPRVGSATLVKLPNGTFATVKRILPKF